MKRLFIRTLHFSFELHIFKDKQGCHSTWKIGKSQGIWKLTRRVREKSLNLKIGQKTKEKAWNFIKFTHWQWSIEETSRQCWKQNMGLESHACDFSANYLLFNVQKSVYLSSNYQVIPQLLKLLIVKFCKYFDCRFQVFGFFDLMIIFR